MSYHLLGMEGSPVMDSGGGASEKAKETQSKYPRKHI